MKFGADSAVRYDKKWDCSCEDEKGSLCLTAFRFRRRGRSFCNASIHNKDAKWHATFVETFMECFRGP